MADATGAKGSRVRATRGRRGQTSRSHGPLGQGALVGRAGLPRPQRPSRGGPRPNSC